MFSIIVPTCDRPDQLAACLAALAELDYAQDRFEVIVVNDGRRPETTAAVNPYRDKLDLRMLAQHHAGPAYARNTGAAHARGRLLAFTDDDCRPARNWLTVLEAFLHADRACVVGGRTVNGTFGNVYATASQLLVTYLCEHGNAEPGAARFLTSNNLALPADVFHAGRGFDSGYRFAAGEDRDFCERFRLRGVPIVYAPDAVVYHAQRLTLWTLIRQQYRYGRGAFRFRSSQARRRNDRIRLEAGSFYKQLLQYPASQTRGSTAARLLVLFVLMQAAHTAGFVRESSWRWTPMRDAS
jgi:GT2 family glycosyltransferase